MSFLRGGTDLAARQLGDPFTEACLRASVQMKLAAQRGNRRHARRRQADRAFVDVGPAIRVL